MASITTWMRLEPHSRGADMDAGLEMRIHDPLWMLTRQWQFGEFQGEDTGSPVWAAFSGDEMPIASYLPGPIAGHEREHVQEYSPDVPLEFLVEGEGTPARDRMSANRRLAVEAGQHFLRLLGGPLAKAYRASLLRAYGVLADMERTGKDPDSLAFLDLMAGRALDGARLLAAIHPMSPEDSAIGLGFDSRDVMAAAQAITAWLRWCERMIGPIAPPSVARPAWNPERMEYACALAAPAGAADDQITLTAAEYPGGRLDWYAFDAMSGRGLKRAISARGRSFRSATLPTSLSFRGMPANRQWEFEDGQVRFGSIQAAPTDLARMLLVEFLTEYGNDFFTIPIEGEAGELIRISNLTITNTFGDVTTAIPFADQGWRMFALSTDPASSVADFSSLLFLPPVLGQHLASPAIEDVHLLRDEMANIAWAVEHVVESECGQPLNRHEAYQARRQREEGDKRPISEGPLIYRLDTWQSTLPEYWIPLLPERPAPGESRMRLACHDPGRSRGQLLSEKAQGTQLYLFDEEVPRMGIHVTRAHQYTRWFGGSMFSWIGREKRPGRGEGSSGLRHDIAEVVAPT